MAIGNAYSHSLFMEWFQYLKDQPPKKRGLGIFQHGSDKIPPSSGGKRALKDP